MRRKCALEHKSLSAFITVATSYLFFLQRNSYLFYAGSLAQSVLSLGVSISDRGLLAKALVRLDFCALRRVSFPPRLFLLACEDLLLRMALVQFPTALVYRSVTDCLFWKRGK